MLQIERMRIQLPAGFEHRASSIARLVGDSLTTIQVSETRRIDKLSIGPLSISANATDREIAHRVTQRLTSMLRRGI